MLHGVVAPTAVQTGMQVRRRRCSPWSARAPPSRNSRDGSPSPGWKRTGPTGWRPSSRHPDDADYAHTFAQVRPPAWLADGAVAGGRFLAEVGLPMPVLNPEHALLLKFTAL